MVEGLKLCAQTFTRDDLGVAIHGQSFAKRAVTDDLAAGYPAPLDGYLLVAHERFPMRHAWLVSSTLSEASGVAKGFANPSRDISWHPGTDMFLKGEPEPRT